MKKYIQIINESLDECGDMPTAYSAPSTPTQPVTVNVNMSASGEENVEQLLKLMKNAGLNQSAKVSPDMMPARKSMDKYISIMDKPVEEDDGYDNTPGELYHDNEMLTHNMSGGINKMKKAYPAAQDGDNAMAVKRVKEQLLRALAEKKSKPDYLDLDGDGDTAEPMKKAAREKKQKKNNKK